jgi:hypothetical protein
MVDGPHMQIQNRTMKSLATALSGGGDWGVEGKTVGAT